jgi:hypothetical protein
MKKPSDVTGVREGKKDQALYVLRIAGHNGILMPEYVSSVDVDGKAANWTDDVSLAMQGSQSAMFALAAVVNDFDDARVILYPPVVC